MKTILVILLLISSSIASSKESITDFSSVQECMDNKCVYKECQARVVQEIDTKAIATCREIYLEGKLLYRQVKVLSQVWSEKEKKSVMTGLTIEVR